jgi:LPXTG-motif cell wall-anchored protein
MAACLLNTAPKAAASENRGSISIKLEAGDLAVTNGAVTLHQVGIKTEEGYRIMEAFGGGIIRQEDADSDNLAKWLAESAAESGLTLLLDADGSAVYSELEEGLYMVVQTERMDGFYPIYPVLLTIPQDGCWDVQLYREPVPVVTEIPKTGQSPIPFLGLLGMVLSSAGLMLCLRKEK